MSLSISRALAEKDWERAEELMRTQEIFECPVDSFNRGGVIVKLGQVRGFVPASQLSSIIPLPTADEGDDRYAALLGGSLRLKVIDIDRKRNRLISPSGWPCASGAASRRSSCSTPSRRATVWKA